MRTKVADGVHSLLHSARAQGRSLPASAVLCPSRVLRQSIFHRRAALDALGERLLDGSRTIGRPDKITIIFGRKITRHYRGKLQIEIEDMHLPNPVVRSHYGNGFIKQYVRDHLMLRTAAATNNVNDYGVNKAVETLPKLREKLSVINDNYQNIQQDILETFIDRGQVRKLGQPTVLPGGKRVPGLKLDHPRQLALMHSLVRFAHVAAGSTFTTAELYPDVVAALGGSTSDYSLASVQNSIRRHTGAGSVLRALTTKNLSDHPIGC